MHPENCDCLFLSFSFLVNCKSFLTEKKNHIKFGREVLKTELSVAELVHYLSGSANEMCSKTAMSAYRASGKT